MPRSCHLKPPKSIVRLDRLLAAYAYPIGVSGVPFNTTTIDTLNESLLPAAPMVTVKHAGYYRIMASTNITVSAGTGDFTLFITDNFNGNTAYGHIYFNLIPMATPQAESIVYLRAGDTIQAIVNNATGAVVNASINVGDTYLLVERL